MSSFSLRKCSPLCTHIVVNILKRKLRQRQQKRDLKIQLDTSQVLRDYSMSSMLMTLHNMVQVSYNWMRKDRFEIKVENGRFNHCCMLKLWSIVKLGHFTLLFCEVRGRNGLKCVPMPHVRQHHKTIIERFRFRIT